MRTTLGPVPMTSARPVVLWLGLALAVLAALGGKARAQQGPGDYIFDKIAKDPQVLRRWQRAVPASFERVDWIYQMQAVTTPVEDVFIGGGPLFRYR